MQAHLSWQRSDDKDESELRTRMDLPCRYLIHPSKNPDPQSPQTPCTSQYIVAKTPIHAVQYRHQNKMIQLSKYDKPPFLVSKSESDQLRERRKTKNSKTFDRKIVCCKTGDSTTYLHGRIHSKICFRCA